MLVKLNHFPKEAGKSAKYLKPPTSRLLVGYFHVKSHDQCAKCVFFFVFWGGVDPEIPNLLLGH